MELDVLLEVVPEVQVILQNVTILEKRIHENPAMGHPEVSFDTFRFGTSRCCSDTSVARACKFPQFHSPRVSIPCVCQGLFLDLVGGPLCPWVI